MPSRNPESCGVVRPRRAGGGQHAFVHKDVAGGVSDTEATALPREAERLCGAENRGGIQLLSKPGGGDTFYPVPRALLFVDPARDSAAVHIALAPLLTHGEPER